MFSHLIIQGAARVHGQLHPGGNKNAALPAIAAAMLCRGTVLLHNMPQILDVQNMLTIATYLGAKIRQNGGDVEIDSRNVTGTSLPDHLCRSIRTSLLFAGPMTARCKEISLGIPGGDMIGRRRLDPHFYGLRKLGIQINVTEGHFHFLASSPLKGAELFLDEASVTATEHILMTAVLAEGTTVIRNAACEPHVEQLAHLLNSMGADIQGAGTNTLIIHGVQALHDGEITIESDYIEAVSYMSLCAATGGELEIDGEISPHNYWMARRIFERFGCTFSVVPGHISLAVNTPLQIQPDFNNAVPVIADGPWPQFASDMMSCMVAMATQARGTVLFFEKMFESRLYFVDKLIAMGANAIVCDPHRVIISGPAQLHGLTMTSPDIRAGMAMIIAACCAKGESVINNIDMVRRGYQSLEQNLHALGIQAQYISE